MKNMRKYQSLKPSVLVVGDLMIDHYLWGRTDSISPEAPVPVIDVQSESEVLGRAGNVVNNLIALGADVSVASVIGKDENGKRLTKMLKSLGIHTDALIAEPERRTTRKSRVIASHQQVVRFDSETRQDITKESEDKILAAIQKKLLVTDIILL
jgi:D-beta-D-heptose 7-phosphate kinase/D-beta-D-heptose 1-phosphate adenosyltransferase